MGPTPIFRPRGEHRPSHELGFPLFQPGNDLDTKIIPEARSIRPPTPPRVLLALQTAATCPFRQRFIDPVHPPFLHSIEVDHSAPILLSRGSLKGSFVEGAETLRAAPFTPLHDSLRPPFATMIFTFLSLIFMVLLSCHATGVGMGTQTSTHPQGLASTVEQSDPTTSPSTFIPQDLTNRPLGIARRELIGQEMATNDMQRARLLSAIFGSVAVFALLLLVLLVLNRDRIRRLQMPVTNEALQVSMERSVSVTRDSVLPGRKPNMFQIPVRITGSARREMRNENARSIVLPIHDVPPALLRAPEGTRSLTTPRTPPGIYVPITPRITRSLSTRLVLSTDRAVPNDPRGKNVTETGVIVIHPPRPPRRPRAPSPPPTYAQSTNSSPTVEMSTVPYGLPRYH